MSSKLTTIMLFFVFVSLFGCVTSSSSKSSAKLELDTSVSSVNQELDVTSVSSINQELDMTSVRSVNQDVTSVSYVTTTRLQTWGERCGDGNQQSLYCECYRYRDTATCRGSIELSRRFTYIPLLPKNITRLEFWNNDLKTVDDRNFFVNVTQLEVLDLSFNIIKWVSAGVFDLMPNLTTLLLTLNPLSNSTALRNVLATPSLVSVYADYCSFPLFGEHFLDDVDVSNVQNIVLSNNAMAGILNVSPLCRLKKLKSLSLGSNQITRVVTNCVFRSLEELDLDKIVLYVLSTCDRKGQSYFPELTNLSYEMGHVNNVNYYFYPPVCLPKLKVLDLDDSRVTTIKNYFDADRYPSLKELHLARLRTFLWLTSSFFNNSAIEFLDLSGNVIDFSVSSVNSDTFSTCCNISTLLLDQNTFSGISEEKFELLFGHLPLKKLSLSQTEFSFVSPKIFSTLTLLEFLDLSHNKIVYIPDGTFDNLFNLRKLFLTENQIHTISPHIFSDRLRQNLLTLDLGLNPFVCSCDLLWFRAWLRSRPKQFNVDEIFTRGIYTCSNRPDKVADFVLPEQVCLMSQEVGGYIITFCTIFILTLTSFLLLVSYRWHLRLLLYEAFRGRDDGVRRQRLLQNNFDYDVFVSFDSEDSPWVRRHLMPELEGRLGLRLCIHERDFTLGRHILDNISESVERSKKVLMVFSNHFVLSQWCQFELTYCLRHVMDYDDALIIVCVDDVTSREMTTAMMAVLKTTTYIQWAGHDDAIRAFWGRVQIALHEILDREHRV